MTTDSLIETPTEEAEETKATLEATDTATEETPAAEDTSSKEIEIEGFESSEAYEKMVPLFKELNLSEDKAKAALSRAMNGEDALTDEDGMIFGKYKDITAAQEAFKSLESENGRLRREKNPEAPEEYTFDFTGDEDLKDIIPEDYDFENDPLLEVMLPVFKETNFTQDQVNAATKAFMQFQASEAPNAEAEMEKLGSEAKEIVSEVGSFIKKNFDENDQTALKDFAYTAENTQLLHKLSKMMKSQSIPSGDDVTTTPTKSSKDLYAEATALRVKPGFEFDTDAKAKYEVLFEEAILAEEKEG